MARSSEHRFAEVTLEKLILENIPEEQSAYFVDSGHDSRKIPQKLLSKLRWHVDHSLSLRQKEVIRLILQGKTEREIAAILGIRQQVVHIYKWRAINRLRDKLVRSDVCQKANSEREH